MPNDAALGGRPTMGALSRSSGSVNGFAGGPQAFANRRMVVEEPRDDWVRVGVGLVELRELDERGTIGRRVRGARERVTVALRLKEPAQRVLRGSKDKAEYAQHQHEQRQRRGI